MKRFIILTILCLSLGISGFSQERTEPQPFPLTDYKITFYEVQMNVATVVVTHLDGSEISGAKPAVLQSDENDAFTIDFTACETGNYLITGKRDELLLEYTVER